MKYEKSYGPSFRRRKPDYKRCAAHVHGDGWGGHQCTRKAVCDPDDSGKPTTCKQHSEEKTRERRAKQDEAFEDAMKRIREQRAAPKMREALRLIANGHNDSRTLAAKILRGLAS